MIYQLSIEVDHLALSDVVNLLQNQAEKMLRWQQATESLSECAVTGVMFYEFAQNSKSDNRITQSIIED